MSRGVWLFWAAIVVLRAGLGCGGDDANDDGQADGDSAGAAASGGSSGSPGQGGSLAGSAGSAGAAGAAGSGGSSGTAGSAQTEDPGRAIPASACRPSGPTADQLGSKRTVLYSGPRALAALSERRGRLFVVDTSDGIMRLAEGESELERVVAIAPSEFLVADLNLYWPRDKGVWRAGLNAVDATPDPVAAQLGHEIALLRYDATHLYFSDPMARGAYRVPLMGGPLETIASGVDARDQIVEAGYLYYADGASKRVHRIAVAGGAMATAVTPVALSEPTAVTAAGETVYWADDFELITSPDASTRTSLAIAGLRASGRPARVQHLELAGERLYFQDDGGNLGWTTLDGKGCGLVVKNASITGSDIDADGKNAYLSVANGAVHELWRVSLQ